MKRNIVSVAAAVIGAGLIITGIVLGQPDNVMAKAVRICMECVGIG